MIRLSRRWSNRKAQALVEFVMVLPIFMLLVVGIIEFGRLISAYQTITDTAREAARRAVVADAPCNEAKKAEIGQMIRRRLAVVGLDSLAVTPQITCAGETEGLEETTVRLTYDYHMGWLGPMIGWTTGDPNVSLETETHMRQE